MYIVMANRSHSHYSGEADLINRSKRALADGKEKESIEKLRLLCLARGASGIYGLGR